MTGGPGSAWHSDVIPAEEGQSYRLDGWLRCREGEAGLGLDFLDEQGALICAARTPVVGALPAWQFVAVETDAPPRCIGARIWLHSTAEAYLDDVVLAPMIVNLMFNPSFDIDAKGRLGYWADDTTIALPDAHDGEYRGEPSAGRTGSALVVEADGWWAARSLDLPLPEGVTTFRFAGWSRTSWGEAPIWVAWVDAKGKVTRYDPVGSGHSENGWTRREATVRRPAEATYARVVAAVRRGEAAFDDFWFSALAPARNRRPGVRVLVNQVGYEAAGPKGLVAATSFFPAKSAAGTVDIVSASGSVMLRLPLRCGGRIHDGLLDDWGGYYWRADFSSLRTPGVYHAVAAIDGVRGESPPFEVGEGVLARRTADLAVRFFFVQRCGFDVPGWHGPCHLDDALLPDGKHIDAVGGWHSAGDYNKLMYENGDGGCAFALIRAYLAAPRRFDRCDRDGDGLPDVIDEAMWGARFVARMQNPETGGLYGTISQGPGRAWTKWSPPEVHTDNIVGTADDPVIAPGEGQSPLAIGAWARLSAMLADRAIPNDYLERAIRLFDHVAAGGGPSASPHLLISALELHAVTGDRRYAEFARRSAEAILATQVTAGRLRGAFGSYGEVSAAALALFALAYPEDPVAAAIRGALRAYSTFCRSTAENPFGLSQQSVGEQDYFFEPTSTLGHNWELLGRAWAAALIHRVNGDARALRFAADQIDWVLGKNSLGLCMFEGVGSLNPPRYHHRYDSIPGRERGAVPGAIPNGFVRSAYALDQPGFDLSYPGSGRAHPSYRTSEPWLTHNMHYLLALSAYVPEGQVAPRAR